MTPTLESLIARSRELKDGIEALEERITPLERDRINAQILLRMQEDGVTTMQTDLASVSRGTRTYARVAGDGREAFMGWLSEHPEGLNLLGNVLQSEALVEYETLFGELPPGVTYYQQERLNMRRRN